MNNIICNVLVISVCDYKFNGSSDRETSSTWPTLYENVNLQSFTERIIEADVLRYIEIYWAAKIQFQNWKSLLIREYW